MNRRPAALPSWAQVGPKRLAHIRRVAALLESWGAAMSLPPDEQVRWQRAGWLHDALRDAPLAELQALVPGSAWDAELLHGPAAANKLEEPLWANDAPGGHFEYTSPDLHPEVLMAVRWHSVGCIGWGATGRALYCADYLDPERSFDREGRAVLAQRFPEAPDAVFREVVMRRVEWTERSGWPLLEPTRELWNSLR